MRTQRGDSAPEPARTVRRPGWRAVVAWSTLTVLALLIVVPLVWPVPPLEDTVPPYLLANADSRFVEVGDLTIHYKEAGSVDATQTLILMHGFGASTYSWRDQLTLLSEQYRVIAFDRPAFGLTERPLPNEFAPGQNPYSAQANTDQVIGLMDALRVQSATLVAHSAGGAVAVLVADQHPDRVKALVLEAPAVAQARTVPTPVSAILRSPQMRRVGPLLVRRIAGGSANDFIRGAYYDPSVVTDEVLGGYRLPLSAENWDRGLWELIAAPRTISAADALERITTPTLVIAGRQDTFVPFRDSVAVADAISGAELIQFEQTGHLPHEERPAEFASAVVAFVRTLP